MSDVSDEIIENNQSSHSSQSNGETDGKTETETETETETKEIIDHLYYMNDLCRQIKNFKNRILYDIYKNQIKDAENKIDFKTFKNTIIKKERIDI